MYECHEFRDREVILLCTLQLINAVSVWRGDEVIQRALVEGDVELAQHPDVDMSNCLYRVSHGHDTRVNKTDSV